jgi:hypothetical protein
VVLADPDGRSVVLARTRGPALLHEARHLPPSHRPCARRTPPAHRGFWTNGVQAILGSVRYRGQRARRAAMTTLVGVLADCRVWDTQLTYGRVPARGLVGACGPESPVSHRVVRGLISRPQVPLRGLSSGFPVVRRVPFPLAAFLRFPFRPAFSGSFPSAVARCRFSFGFPPGSFPLGNIHTSAPAGRVPRALVPGGRDQGHQSCRDRLAWIARYAAHSRWAAAGHDGMPPQNRLLRAAASAVHRRKRTAQIGGCGCGQACTTCNWRPGADRLAGST